MISIHIHYLTILNKCSYIKFHYSPIKKENIFSGPVAFLKINMILNMMPCYLEGHQHFKGYLFHLRS
jgi:hypothetical protein